MSYSILRLSKVKSNTNINGINRHVKRLNKNYNNQDIDKSKTNLNYDLVKSNYNFEYLINKEIEKRYNNKRKIRSDAIKLIDGIVTSDTDFFEGKSELEIRQFFEKSKEFLEKQFGKENLLYATVHLDEKTPHLHFGLVPITKDGRLSAKEFVGNKKHLTDIQNAFNDHLRAIGYDLDRGIPKDVTGSKHVDMDKFKQVTNYHKEHLKDLEQQISDTEEKLRKVDTELDDKVIYNGSYNHRMKKISNVVSKYKPVELHDASVGEIPVVYAKKEEFDRFNKIVLESQKIIEDYNFLSDDYTNFRLKEEKEEKEKLRKELEEKEKQLKAERERNDKLKKEYFNLSMTNVSLEDEIEKHKKYLIQTFKVIKKSLVRPAYEKIVDIMRDFDKKEGGLLNKILPKRKNKNKSTDFER